MTLAPDHKVLYPSPYRTLAKAPGPNALLIGDVVALRYGHNCDGGLEGTITGYFQGDRYKVEVTDIDGQTYRYSVPRNLLRIIRRAEA